VQLTGHRYGIAHAAFSPSGRHLVTVGNAFDNTLQIWDWHDNVLLSTVRLSDAVTGVDFSADGSYFITSANKQLRFWNFDPTGQKLRAAAAAASAANAGGSPVSARGSVSSVVDCVIGALGDFADECLVACVCARATSSSVWFCIVRSALDDELSA